MHTSALEQQWGFPHDRKEGGNDAVTEHRVKPQSFGEY